MTILMRQMLWVLVAGLATIGLSVIVATGRGPIRLAGEWEWGRVEPATYWPESIAIAGGYAVLILVVSRWIKDYPWRRRVATVSLVPLAVGVQFAVQFMGFGLAKWPFILFHPSSSGYYTASKWVGPDRLVFLQNYREVQATYLETEGPYHVATHPPGLLLLHYEFTRWCEAHPVASRWVLDHAPSSIQDAFLALGGELIPVADRASLWLVAVLSQLLCVLTVIPVFWLARHAASPAAAWTAAALWPLVPATTLFMPKSDVLYPLFAVSCVALGIVGRSAVGRILGGFGAGLTLILGLYFSFALVAVLPLLLLAAVIHERSQSSAIRRALMERFGSIGLTCLVATGVYWAATGHNMFSTWLDCYRAHASFYDRHARDYTAWLAINPIEFSVALGLPLTCASLAGAVRLLRGPDAGPNLSPECQADWSRIRAITMAWLVTIAALNLSGKNLGEVARLWIFLMPFAVPAAAVAIDRLGDRVVPSALVLFLQATQSIVLAANVQVFIDPQSIRLNERGAARDPRGVVSEPAPTTPWRRETSVATRQLADHGFVASA